MDANWALGEEFRFAGFTLDPARGVLLAAGGAEVPLRPKSMALLRFLIANAGRLLSRDAIMAAIWPEVVVTDQSITQCVHDIRRALGDKTQQLLRTVPKGGYLLAAEVTASATAANVGGGNWPLSVRPPPPDRPSIAVLPFQNLSGDPNQDYYADGVVEDVTTELARVRWLFVIARNSSFAYRDRPHDIRRIGQELGVRYVLEGSVRRVGSHVRITAQLIDAVTGGHLWADRFDGELADIFEVQDRLTASVVCSIAVRLEEAEIARVKRKPTERLCAYEYFLRWRAARRS
jgi:TolB-like protein